MVSDFGASCGFTASLQTNEHDNINFSSFGLVGLLAGVKQSGEFLDNLSFNKDPQVASGLLLVFELVEYVFPELEYIFDVYIACDQSIAYFLQAFFYGFLVDYCAFVELVQGACYFAAEFC